MTERKRSTSKSAKRGQGGASKQKDESAAQGDDSVTAPAGGELGQFMTEMVSSLTQNALQLANISRSMPGKLAQVLLLDGNSRETAGPEYLQMLADAGAYLKDARQVAGLTIDDLGAAMNVSDKNLLQAVEAGSATLSFDLILRLASLLARHDPVPFVLKLARAYNPQAWQVLENWGVGRLPLQLAREREFINIYRANDEVRDLSDEEFARVLAFTEQAFELALAFRNGDQASD